MHCLRLLLGALVLTAPWTISAQYDNEAAANALAAIQRLHGVSVQSEQSAAQQLAAVFKENPGAFGYAGPAGAAPDPWQELGEVLNNNISIRLLGKAVDILVGNGTMKEFSLAVHIISTYISYPNNPPSLPLSSPHQCGTKLVTVLAAFASDLLSGNYIKVLLPIMDLVIKGPQGPGGFLGSCQPDLPAVMLSLASANCPRSGSQVYPVDNGTNTANIKCTPSAGDTADRSSLAALLGGALMSQLLLSSYPVVDTNPTTNTTVNVTLGKAARVLSWAMTRMAFAVLQSKSYADCIDNLIVYEAKIPSTSAPPRPIGPLYMPMTPQGAGTLCGAVAMRSWKANTPVAQQPWDESVMVQSLMNVWLATGQTMQDKNVVTASRQRFILCSTLSDVLRFKGSAKGSVYDMFMPDKYQCVLNKKIQPCPPVGVPPFAPNATWFVKLPNLKEDLGSRYFACRYMVNKRLMKGN